MNTFSELLENFRVHQGISKKTLAQISSLTPGYVSLLTRGERTTPSLEAVVALTNALSLNEEQRSLFFEAAGYSSFLSSPNIFSNVISSSSYTAEETDALVDEQKSSVPMQETFYGREKELKHLRQLMLGSPPVRCLAVLGLGGVGKTSIAIRLVETVQQEHKFEYIHWYSFQTPSEETFSHIVDDCLHFFSDELLIVDDSQSNLDTFLTCLEKHRCLIILDNFESLLKSGSLVGEYERSYNEYGTLLDVVCSQPHRSCFLLTSREKPREIANVEGTHVKSMLLSGVEDEDGRKILRDKGLMVENEIWRSLVQLYSGNPFALQLVSPSIRDIFGGDIAAFLNNIGDKQEQEKVTVVSVVHDLLDQQFQRLSEGEKEVMYWLAIEREAVDTKKLREDILHAASKPDLLRVLESLLRRSLIERRDVTRFGLKSLTMDYVTNQLVQEVCNEIEEQQAVLLESHSLIKAETEDYIRREQMRSILGPLQEKLLANFTRPEIESKLQNLLVGLRQQEPPKSGYTAGNILNLLLYLEYDVHNYDFSSLTVRQAYLREKGLPDVNFARANLAGSAFADTFGSVLSVAISPDGKLLAAGTVNGEVRIWQMEKRILLHTCKGHTDWVRSIAFSADGQMLASGSHDRTIRIWNVETGQGIHLFTGHTNRVRAVAFSAIDEKPLLLASSSDDKTVRIWDVNTGECLHVLSGHQGKINAIAFSFSNHALVSVSHDETIRVWDTESGDLLQEMYGTGGWIWSVDFSHDSNMIACGNEDGTISLWDMQTYRCLKVLTAGHSARVNTVAFSPRRDTLISGSDDRTIRVWNMSTGRSQIWSGHTSWVRSVSVSYDGATIVSGSDDETVRIWDANTNQCLYTMQGYSGWVYSVAFNSKAPPLIASGGDETRVRLWDEESGERLFSLSGHTHRVRSITFSPDNSKIASASDDQTVRIWEVETGIYLQSLRGHRHRVRSIAFSPDNSKIASASDDQTVRIWEVETGMCLRIINAHASRVYSVAWSHDGRFLVSSSEDESICLWDAHTYERLKVFSGHKGRVYAVSFTPDSTCLISGGDDLVVRLWNISTGLCIHEMKGHTGRICSLAFSSDGQMFASASDDRTVCIWNTRTGNLLHTIQGTQSGHSGRVSSVAFFESSLLATGSYDGTIKLWHPQSGEFVKQLRSERPYERVNIADVRGLTAAQKAMLKKLGAVAELTSERSTL